MTGSERTRQVALGLLIFFIGASALAFGSVELWAQEWLRFGGLLTLAIILWTVPPRDVLGGTAGRLALPIALLVVWGFAQTVPLPRGVLELVSPRTVAVYERTVPPADGEALPAWLLERAEADGLQVKAGEIPAGVPDAGDPVSGRCVSLYPHATRHASLSWVTALIFFLVAAWISRSDVARYRLLWGISTWAGFIGLLAILQTASWNNKILWIRDRPSGTHPLGPFVNPTHFAGYVEMGLLVALGLILALLSRPTGKLNGAGVRAAILDRGWTLPRLLLLGAVATLATAGLLLARSEGGLLAFAVGLVFILLAKKLRGAMAIAAIAIVVLGVAAGLVNLLGPVVSELGAVPLTSSELSPSFLLRVDSWARTLEMFRDFPVVGTGLGTFQWAFAGYLREGEWMSWADAHNDYLQVLAEAGLVGMGLLAWALWVFIARALRPAVQRSSHQTRWTSVGTAAAVFAMLVHSIVDFNLQTPSNAVLFSVLVGILVGASWSQSKENARS